MKKKVLLVVLAGVASVPALAQSNVTLTGRIAVSYNNHKVTDTLRPMATENRLDDDSSRFILKGTEDLGGGLSAYFQLENRVSVDTRPNSTFGSAQGLGDGESFVGIKSSRLGQIGFGKFQMHYHESAPSEAYRAQQTQILASQNILSQIDATKIMGSRAQNTIKYDTPNWSGFSAKLAYSFSPNGNEGTVTNTGANGGVSNQYGGNPVAAINNRYNQGYAWTTAARYENGPVNALLSYYQFKPENGARAASQNSWRAHFDYQFAMGLRLGLGYDRSEILGATRAADYHRGAWMVPVTYTMGAHAFYLTYAKADSRSNLPDSGASQYTLAYDYALSKRTFVGVSYVRLRNERNALYRLWNAGTTSQGGSEITVAGEDSRIFSLNLTHSF